MIRRPPRSTRVRSSAASDVYKRQDNNVEQALRVLKRKLQRDGFFKIVKLKSNYEKPSEKKKRILQENIKRVKKLNKLKNRI